MKRIIAIVLCLVCMVGLFTGCTAAENVNYNLSQAADNFQVMRRITVYNARTDMIVMEIEGLMSLSNNTTRELVVTCKTGEDEFKKHYVYLNDYVIYAVEDITGTVTDPYHHKIHFYTAVPDIDWNK